MILIDVNLLIYAYDRDAPQYQRARTWLESVLSANVAVGLPWLVILAFLRITTNNRAMVKALAVEQALEFVNSWLQQPLVSPLHPGERHWIILQQLLQDSGTGGNLSNDAHIAAIALEHGYTVYSADNDFKRFGVRHINPLASREVHETAAGYKRRGKRAAR
jgi:toxin-antitoxin system PIN domain toxin